VASPAQLPSRRRWSSRGEESGFTLIEVLITVVIMGIAVVTLVGGMLSAVTASDLQRKDTVLATSLRAYAESIKSSVQQSCLQGQPTFTATSPGPLGYIEVISNGTTTCPPVGSTSQLVLTATAADGTTASITIVVAVP